MAQVTFGNYPVDMRLENDWYGIADLQTLDAFLTGFVPVGTQTLISDATTFQMLEWDAAYNQVMVTFTGNIPYGIVNTMRIDAQGIVLEYGGNFQINPYTAVLSGWVTSESVRYAANNALIGSLSGSNFYVSTDSATLADPSDAIELAGNDTITAGTGNDYLLGYSGDDSISGGGGNDTLDGGPGNDTLIGGAGNDTYLIDSTADLVVESAGQGTDTVLSSLNYQLGANLENLTLTGSGNLSATGNTSNNVLTGNTGNNTLDGGKGADSLIGGMGDDTYLVDNAGDVVTENPIGGTDTVQSSITHTLAAHVENLVLNASAHSRGILGGLHGGRPRDIGVDGGGNDGDNLLVGNGAANRLAGGAGDDRIGAGAGDDLLIGGAGSDVLIGGYGRDTFLLDSLDGIDRIADFAAEDCLWFDHTVFGGLDLGALAQAAFASGAGLTAAQDANDRLIHDTTSGALYYDSDGLGGTAAVQVAVLLTQAYGAGQLLGQLEASQVWVI